MQTEAEKNILDLILGGTDKQIMSCSATYQKKLQGKYLTLKDCDEMLAKSVTEINNAIDDHSMATRLLAVATIIKMVCDVIILIASQSIRLAPGVGDVIDTAYGGATMMAETVAGSKVDSKKVLFLLAQNKGKVVDEITKGLGKKATHIAPFVKAIEILSGLYEYCTTQTGGGEGLVSARNTVSTQLGQVRIQIQSLEIEMKKCGLATQA